MTSIGQFVDDMFELIERRQAIKPIGWNEHLKDAGFYGVDFKPCIRIEAIDWCREHIGQDHFVWTGSKFFFETEADAIMFTLRWGNGN